VAEITQTSQIRINGKIPQVLSVKVRLSDDGKNWKEVIKTHLKNR